MFDWGFVCQCVQNGVGDWHNRHISRHQSVSEWVEKIAWLHSKHLGNVALSTDAVSSARECGESRCRRHDAPLWRRVCAVARRAHQRHCTGSYWRHGGHEQVVGWARCRGGSAASADGAVGQATRHRQRRAVLVLWCGDVRHWSDDCGWWRCSIVCAAVCHTRTIQSVQSVFSFIEK